MAMPKQISCHSQLSIRTSEKLLPCFLKLLPCFLMTGVTRLHLDLFWIQGQKAYLIGVFHSSCSCSGLDSISALCCVLVMKSLAAAGHTVLCSIHNPSAKLFSHFDRVRKLDSLPTPCIFLGLVVPFHTFFLLLRLASKCSKPPTEVLKSPRKYCLFTFCLHERFRFFVHSPFTP